MNPIPLRISELKPALTGLSKVIPRSSTLPVLSHVRVERTRSGHLELTATDLDSSAIVRLDTPVQGDPVRFLIPFEELNRLTRNCGRHDTLLVAPANKSTVAMKLVLGSQIIDHLCESLPVEEFPVTAEFTGEAIPLEENVRHSIHEALACASSDETRPILNGACLDVSDLQGHYVVGTDGRHLFSSNSCKLPLEESLIIPSHRFLAWKEFAGGDGDWKLRVAKPAKDAAPQIEIASDHWRFTTRAPEGNYPNWRLVQPAEDLVQSRIEIEPSAVTALVQIIQRLPSHDTGNFALGLEITGRTLRLLARSSPEHSWSGVAVEGTTVTGKDVIVFLNRHYLVKALRFGLIRIGIIDPLAPLRFSDGAGKQMIVMPVRQENPATLTQPSPSDTSSSDSTSTATGSAAPSTRIQSPPQEAEQYQPEPERRTHMPENSGMTTIRGSGNGHKPSPTLPATATTPEKAALEAALAQAEAVKNRFREAISDLTRLIDLLKQVQREQKGQEKEIASVRQTLRSLQSVHI